MEIAGRGEQLSEYLIGVEALGRPNGYSPGEDPVVRRRAVHLREKLDEVYATDLAGAAVRIELPKGRYVPRFVRVEAREAPSPAAIPLATPAPAVVPASADPVPAGRFGLRHLAAAFLAGVLLASGAFVAWLRLPASRREHLLEWGTTYEAESSNNVFTGMTKAVMGCANCSGGGRVRSIGAGGRNYVEFLRVNAREAGEHAIEIHYMLDGQRSFFVSVNGAPGVEVRLTADNWSVP